MYSKFLACFFRWPLIYGGTELAYSNVYGITILKSNKTRYPWAKMLTWVNSYKSLIQHFLGSQWQWQQIKMSNLHTFLYLVEDYSTNDYKKSYAQIRQQLQQNFIFPIISLWKPRCHSNQSVYAAAVKNNNFLEANAMNISAKFQLHPPYSFWEVDFFNIFRKVSLLVTMTTNPIERFGQKVYV